jgi:FkbM family methyltransferase
LSNVLTDVKRTFSDREEVFMFISYASNYEDVLLNRVFCNSKTGFYIDIGADHPLYASTTKSFYDRGWHGINVEPGPNFGLFIQERPRDINVKAAVTDRDGEIDFFVNDNLTATSSVNEAIHPAVEARVSSRTRIRVPTMSLDSIVKKYVAGDVQFLKIDAEGSESLIIASADWSCFRPFIIVAESTEPFSTKRVDQQWSQFLRRNGYSEVYFDGINTWFVREESVELQRYFSFPVNVLDDFIDYEKSVLRNLCKASSAPLSRRSGGLWQYFARRKRVQW